MLYQFLFFYTDGHDIDEDMRTISSLNGCHMDDVFAGIFYRFLFDDPSVSSGLVASRLSIREAFCSSYTDYHDIDEDMRTISVFGGWLGLDSWNGLFFRNLADTPSNANDGLASRSVID